MGQPAAKQGDKVVAVDSHLVYVPAGTALMPFPFNGIIDGALSSNVKIGGMPAATVNSTATNTPPHVGSFVIPPTNRATIIKGSATVMINGQPAARAGDTALTCNNPPPVGTVVAVGTVNIGG